jgi:hypothetical protein
VIQFPARPASIALAVIEYSDATTATCAARSRLVAMLHYHANSDSTAYAHRIH